MSLHLMVRSFFLWEALSIIFTGLPALATH